MPGLYSRTAAPSRLRTPLLSISNTPIALQREVRPQEYGRRNEREARKQERLLVPDPYPCGYCSNVTSIRCRSRVPAATWEVRVFPSGA
jgi:hypothetical protein